MNLIIVSPFWNSPELTKKCIESLKSQYYTSFKAYFIDDISTDNSYDVAKKTIGDDNRFVLIKNTIKKHKTNMLNTYFLSITFSFFNSSDYGSVRGSSPQSAQIVPIFLCFESVIPRFLRKVRQKTPILPLLFPGRESIELP